MGNCSSEDMNCVGFGILRKESGKNTKNETDFVIGPNPIFKQKQVNATDDYVSAPYERIPFPMKGIKLSYLLNRFVKECGGRKALKNQTTYEVCDRYVKPKTKKDRLSYCDIILQKSKTNSKLDGVVNTASVFISHAWQFKFLDVLDALENHFKDEPNKMIWFDLVSYNQHKNADGLSCEWLTTTFKDALEQIGHTVTIVTKWNDPIPYKRAWCIFEAYCTSVTDAKFEIAMSNNEHQAFIEECKNGSTDVINEMLSSIVDAEKSVAWNPMDKERIHSVIRNEIGFSKINSIVSQQLYKWMHLEN